MVKVLSIYEQCKNQLENNKAFLVEDNLLPSVVDVNTHSTFPKLQKPVEVSDDYSSYIASLQYIYYISDIHLAHKIISKYKDNTTDEQVKRYICKIARELFKTLDFKSEHHNQQIIVFGGDISANIRVSEIFYTEFMRQCNKSKISLNVYAIIGNHEFWNFKNQNDCFKTHRKLFNSLGIIFLENTISKLDIGNYRRNCYYLKDVIIVGGTGFAGYNDKFNANNNIYGAALDRKQEICETKKWEKVYKKALEDSKKSNSILIVITHNPITDWKENGLYDANCVYFNGHNHQNKIFFNDTKSAYIFADNQIGYINKNVSFKKADIYMRKNPFADYNDGYYKITIEDYVSYYRYIMEVLTGTKKIQNTLNKNMAELYVFKHSGYYGFFIIGSGCIYILQGGNILKIEPYVPVKQLYDTFIIVINKFLRNLTPYNQKLFAISNSVKAFGGNGKIHGCIVDISCYCHIMLNPFDGKFTYYYSPEYGEIKTYKSIYTLLKYNCKILLDNYKNYVESTINNSKNFSFPEQVTNRSKLIKIQPKNSLYIISNKIYQIQRLFDVKLLRYWNSDLLEYINDIKKLLNYKN